MQIEEQNGILLAGGRWDVPLFPLNIYCYSLGRGNGVRPYLTLSKHVRTALSCVGISVERSRSLRLPGLIKLDGKKIKKIQFNQ
jgi:hypothetical protein